jgi:hypothetical protein
MASNAKIAGYEFSRSARFQKGAISDAMVVGNHLELLRKRHKGELTPEDVLADAKGHNSPLHSFFEWDDSEAAHQHRLAQARGLIRSVVAIYTSTNEPARRMKAFIHIPEPGTPHYRDTAQALSETKTRELVLRRAWAEFQEFKRKYEGLLEFSAIFEVAEEVRQKLLGNG